MTSTEQLTDEEISDSPNKRIERIRRELEERERKERAPVFPLRLSEWTVATYQETPSGEFSFLRPLDAREWWLIAPGVLVARKPEAK